MDFPVSGQVADAVLRGELIWSPNRHFNHNKSGVLQTITSNHWLLGVGADLSGPMNSFINLQLMIDRVEQYSAGLVRPKTDIIWSATYKKSFEEQFIDFEARWYGANQSDGLLRLSAN